MLKFFSSIIEIERYIEPYRRDHSLRCKHCAAQGHLISHGFIYKQLSMHQKETVGKRLVCSNRHGHLGCGRTMQLQLAPQIPHRQYSALQLALFIILLLSNCAVPKAYQQATQQTSTRQAWRWLSALKANLMHYRVFLKTPLLSLSSTTKPQKNITLTCLAAMRSQFSDSFCQEFQQRMQIAFI